MNYYICKPVTAEKLSILLKAVYELSRSEAGAKTGAAAEDTHIRYIMAGNPHTAPAVLSRLAKASEARIRACVAENPHTPVETLCLLAGDKDPQVRAAVSENNNLPSIIRSRREARRGGDAPPLPHGRFIADPALELRTLKKVRMS